MKAYLITKNVNLLAGDKKFQKDRIITADDVGQKNIERYLKKGYIKDISVEKAHTLSGGSALPSPVADGAFFTPEQINAFTRPQLIEYARHIGVIGFRHNTSAADLRKLINSFIEGTLDADKDELEEDEEEEDEEEDDGPG